MELKTEIKNKTKNLINFPFSVSNRKQQHPKLTPEIRRELLAGQCRDVEMMEAEGEANQMRPPAELIPNDFDDFEDDGEELDVPDDMMDDL